MCESSKFVSKKWGSKSLAHTPMKATHCPLCYEPLEVREVGPCMECGFDPKEIEHARAGIHTYAEYRIFGDLTLVLCDFCQCDFSSYDPTFFGLPRGTRVGMERTARVGVCSRGSAGHHQRQMLRPLSPSATIPGVCFTGERVTQSADRRGLIKAAVLSAVGPKRCRPQTTATAVQKLRHFEALSQTRQRPGAVAGNGGRPLCFSF